MSARVFLLFCLCCTTSAMRKRLRADVLPSPSSSADVDAAIVLGRQGTGPQNCVKMGVEEGKCVITTNCPQNHIDVFNHEPFVFMCLNVGQVPSRHIYPPCNLENKGVCFLANQTLHSSTQCQGCRPALGVEGGMRGEPQKASFYGPSSCVSTYRSKRGTCIIQTRCVGVPSSELESYNYGLTCVGSDGRCVRHLFGVNSFDEEETFDTMISCSLCVGMSGNFNRSDFVSVGKGEENGVKEKIKAEKRFDRSIIHHDISELKKKVESLENSLKNMEIKLSETTTTTSSQPTSSPPSNSTNNSSNETTTTTTTPTASVIQSTTPPSASVVQNGTGELVANVFSKPLTVTRRIIKKTRGGDTIETIEYGERGNGDKSEKGESGSEDEDNSFGSESKIGNEESTAGELNDDAGEEEYGEEDETV